MENTLSISPDGLDFMRAKASDHLVLDWMRLKLAGLEEFKITEMEKMLRVSRKTAKHKVSIMIRTGLVELDRMESRYRIYRLARMAGVDVNGRI